VRFIILDTDYPEFLGWLYARHHGLEKQPYEEQMRARNESLFGVADFYSSNLRKLGHEAYDIHANNEFMQKAWAKEHAIRIKQSTSEKFRAFLRQFVPIARRTPLRYLRHVLSLRSLEAAPSWFYDVLAQQIKYYQPDVLLNQAMDSISSAFLKGMKSYVRLLAGQIASPLPKREDFGCYDLVVSSLPNFVDHFRRLGVPSELNRLAFEPRVLERLDENESGSKATVSFVGSLSPAHETRVRLLEHLCQRLPVDIWGQGIESLPTSSPIHKRFMGRAWGIEMYRILRSSKITLNHHIDVSGRYANNCRLYEATGVGTLLITDWKENLEEMFEPGKEVITYRTAEECAEWIRYFLEHGDERKTIANAGQQRTLREHSYYQRMQELENIVRKYL
jgi:spore maturation protein CgeB